MTLHTKNTQQYLSYMLFPRILLEVYLAIIHEIFLTFAKPNGFTTEPPIPPKPFLGFIDGLRLSLNTNPFPGLFIHVINAIGYSDITSAILSKCDISKYGGNLRPRGCVGR